MTAAPPPATLLRMTVPAAWRTEGLVARWTYARMLRLCEAAGDAVRRVSEPEEAELIVFVCPLCPAASDVLADAAFREFPSRCAVLDQSDDAVPTLPGLYANLADLSAGATRPAAEYTLYLRVMDNPHLIDAAPPEECDLLFSFMGSAATAPGLRGRVLKLRHPRALVTTGATNDSRADESFGRSLARSKFVLCPRGLCPSTFRVFEAMRTGRVPVVLSDRWRPFGDLPWEEFALHVPERDVETLPALLERLEPEAAAMGARARRCYEDCFDVTTAAPFLIDRLRRMRERSAGRRSPVGALWGGARAAARRGRAQPRTAARRLRAALRYAGGALRLGAGAGRG